MALLTALIIVVVVVVGAGGFWWYVMQSSAAAEAEAAERIEELGGFVRKGQDGHVRTVNLSPPKAHENIDAIVQEIPSLGYLENLNALNAPVTDEHLEPIGRTDSLLALNLTNTNVGDAGMAHLTGLDNLVSLEIYGTDVTDKGLEAVGRLYTLKILNIGNTRVTGDLSQLLPLENLERLLAGNLELSDDVVATLVDLPNLRRLDIPNATISDEARAELRQKKPTIEVAGP